MKGWLSIIVGIFLAFGVTAGAMAHATEVGFRNSTVASVDGCESASKKSDDGKSDPSKTSIKFHGCHGHHRSEEHTSELQSLMRISYAVFCLKKKKYQNNQYTTALPYTSAI